MTFRWAHDLTCNCGHKGQLIMSENDAPFSKAWERYRLSGFLGSGHYAEPSCTWEEAFEAMRPICPDCAALLTPDNMREPSAS